MKQIRNRPLANPIVLQEIVYNYRQERTDQSSEPSFLKLSEKHSQEFNVLKENDLFREMQNRLEDLENKHLQKLAEIAEAIKHKGSGKKGKEGLEYGNELARENKEKTTYRELKSDKYQQIQEFEQDNFEMDENRNYVKNSHKQFYSRELNDSSRLSKKSFILSESSDNQAAVVKESQSIVKNKGRLSFHSQLKIISSQSQVSDGKQSQKISRTKRKTTLSSNKEQLKRGRVYESILSLYSTAKLLAMQKTVI